MSDEQWWGGPVGDPRRNELAAKYPGPDRKHVDQAAEDAAIAARAEQKRDR